MSNSKRKLLCFICLFCLVVTVNSVFFVAIAQPEDEAGSINFLPNATPSFNISQPIDKPESFRFEWYDNKLDIELFFNATYKNVTRLFSLHDFEDDFNATVDYQTSRQETYVVFGWVVNSTEANKVHNALFKIEDTSFDIEEIDAMPFVTENGTEYFVYSLPDNLQLSFDNLEHKGFILGYQNKTTVSCKGFSNKTSWNLDPIVFSGDTINPKGYDSPSSPLDCDQLYEADLAGYRELRANEEFEEDYSGYIYLDTQPKPADWGACQIICNVTDRTGYGTAELSVIGWGADPEETVQQQVDYEIATGSEGLYYTLLAFREVTQIYCLIQDGNVSFQILQARWGCIWELDETSYLFDNCRLHFGSTIVADKCYFNETNKQMFFNIETEIAVQIGYYCSFKLGTVEDTTAKATSNGCSLVFNLTGSGQDTVFYARSVTNIEIYGSSFQSINQDNYHYAYFYHSTTNVFLYETTFNKIRITGNIASMPTFDIRKVTLTADHRGYIGFYQIAGTFQDVKVESWTNAFQQSIGTVKGATLINCERVGYFYNYHTAGYIIDTTSDQWNFSFLANYDVNIYRQNSFDLEVVYFNGYPVVGANVTITNYGENATVVYEGVTNTTGQIDTQTLNVIHYNYTGQSIGYDYNPYNIHIESYGMYDVDYNVTIYDKTALVVGMYPQPKDYTIRNLLIVIGLLGIVIGASVISSSAKKLRH